MSAAPLLAAALLGTAPVADAPAADTGRPNVVVILADDMGLGDVGAFNPSSRIPTPHLDRLAAGGIRLTDAHAPAAWCTPTRYSLLTGRYPFRGRPWKWDGAPEIDEDTPTLPGMFRDAGYRTAMVGKWHLGFVTPDGTDLPKRRDVEHLGGPVDRGFDSWFGITVSLDGPPYYYVRDRRAVVPCRRTRSGRGRRRGGARFRATSGGPAASPRGSRIKTSCRTSATRSCGSSKTPRRAQNTAIGRSSSTSPSPPPTRRGR